MSKSDRVKNAVLTFDCYGTLIDWEAGIRNAFKLVSNEDPARIPNIFGFYEEEERRLEKQSYKPYRHIVSQAMLEAARRVGISSSIEKSRLVAKNLPTWKPFPDTNPVLERLAKKYSLGILSNIDNDLLAETLKHFTVKFDIVVTAEDVRSYKPRHAHFEEAAKAIGKRKWHHVAASLYHDIAPTSQLGIDSVWVNRNHIQPDPDYSSMIRREVSDLYELAKLLV